MNRRVFLYTLVSSCVFANGSLLGSDVYLSSSEFESLKLLRKRLIRLIHFIGYANFNIVSFDDALFYARNYPKIGSFTKDELNLIEKLFYEKQRQYGFYGAKTCSDIHNKISKKDVIKIPYTGHYLFLGKPYDDYMRLRKDIGDTLILTSGVRNVVKQLYLYVNKIYKKGGNITKATIDIAPPAYSYHTVSDFDVGRVGWGYRNFTSDFALTNEFRKMRKLSYISMRYDKNNNDGVRYEPWHVEVI